MSVRAEQKAKTRESIIQALLSLSDSSPLTSIGLREVTREAGIAPASFYRHFKDMDELVLLVVNQVLEQLRKLMREARIRVQQKGSLIDTSVNTFMEFVETNPRLFRLLAEDRGSGPEHIKHAIQQAKVSFIAELAEDLISSFEPSEKHPSLSPHLTEAADLMVNQVFTKGLDAIDMSKEEKDKLAEKLILQLRMVWLGSYYLK